MKPLSFLAAFAALALPAFAQQNRYSITSGDVVLSAAAYTLTLQKPALVTTAGKTFSVGKDTTLETVVAYCSVSCSISQSINGTAATATAATVSTIPPNIQQRQTANGFTTSNAGAGTAIGGIIHIPAGGTITLDVSKVTLNGAGTGANYSVTVAAITGTANLTMIWNEAQ